MGTGLEGPHGEQQLCKLTDVDTTRMIDTALREATGKAGQPIENSRLIPKMTTTLDENPGK
jgi:hypothetical protein